MKRSALPSAVVLLALVLTLLPLQTVAWAVETTAPPKILRKPLSTVPPGRVAAAPRSPRPAGTISRIPQAAVPRQAGWVYGPPSDFQYQRFDGIFVPGPEPWGNKVYFMGGRISAPSELPNIWVFDPLTGEYADTTVDVIEDVSNYNADLVVDDGTGRGPAVYVVGGYDKDGGGGGGGLGLVQRFYPMTGEIEGLPPADNWPGQVGGGTVAGMGTAAVDDVIYVYGGWNSSAAPYFYAGTWAFDPRQPSGSRWTDLGVTLNPGRAYIQSAVQDGKIYAMGGVSGYIGGDLVPTAVVEVLDTSNLAAGWQPVASLPIATGEGRGFGFDSDTMGEAVPTGRLYLAGGGDWPATSTEVMEYIVFTDTWDLSFPDLNEPRVNHAGTFIPLETLNPNDGLPGMWVFGGRSHNGCDPPYAPTEFYSFPSEPVGCNVLLVDDDWDQYSGEPFNGSGTYYYTSTLDAIGVNYDRWDVWTQGDPSLADLLSYDAVIWFTGYAWDGTITPTNEADLAAYLENGGNLLLSSYDYLYDQGLSSFGSGYLGIGDYTEDTGDIDPVGNAGNIVGDGLGPYTLTAPTSWPAGSSSIDYTDRVYPGAWAEAPFRYFSNNHANSTNYDSGLYRVVFLGWPFEGLADLDDRVDVLSSALQWFCYTERPAEVLLVPPSQTGYGVRGTDVAYTLTLINNTALTDTFTLAYDAAWPIVGPAAVGPVAGGAALDFVVTVTVAADSNCYDEDLASIIATSSISPTVYTDSAFLRTVSLSPGEGALDGIVYDANTGLGIPDAQVYLSVGGDFLATWTAADGSYSLILDACTYEGGGDAIGYEGALYTVTVDLAATTTLDLVLDAAWPELTPGAVGVVVPEGGSAVLTLTLANSGTHDLYFHFEELPGDLVYPQGDASVPAGVDPQIMQEIAVSPDGRTLFVVYMDDQADLSAAYGIEDWGERGWYVYNTLQATAERSQAGVRAYLEAQGIAYQPILSANALAVTADASAVQSLAAISGVAYLRANQRHYTQPDHGVEQPEALYAPAQVGSPTWGMSLTQAARVWSALGITGTGVVVANIDTGVHWAHEALLPAYRGWDGVSASHDYNWWDPSDICVLEGFPAGEPCDNDSHGSATMGLMVGWNRQPDAGDPAWTAFGMAPGARWMACKGCEYAYCTEVALLSCADFVLAPWDLGGANPDPGLRPHVVNNSWGGGPAEWWYNQAVSAWRAAGIFPAFAAGNSGPACGTAESPGDYGMSFATCATDINDETASYSSRGPAQVSGILKPNVCAPGPGTCTAYNGDELYGCDFGGTSAASPHSAGLAALLWSAQPELVGDVALTSWLIERSAFPITSTQGCGGDDPADVPNNEYGWGRIDAYAAVDMALNQAWDIPWVDVVPVTGQVGPGQSADIQLLFDAAGLAAEACYTGTLRVEYNDPYVMEGFLPLELCVQCVPVGALDLNWMPATPTAGLPLTLTASADGTEPIAYTWDLGDGSGAAGMIVSHTYASGGDYRVVLTATNCQTATAVAVYTITVQAGCEPVAGLDFAWLPSSPLVNQDVVFTAQASGTAPITFSWDLGDGATRVSTGTTAVHAYTMSGSYTVTLTAENSCGQDAVVYELVVGDWQIYLPVVFKNASE